LSPRRLSVEYGWGIAGFGERHPTPSTARTPSSPRLVSTGWVSSGRSGGRWARRWRAHTEQHVCSAHGSVEPHATRRQCSPPSAALVVQYAAQFAPAADSGSAGRDRGGGCGGGEATPCGWCGRSGLRMCGPGAAT
ncbi:unnamed protein product, partial [Closterium sp. Naga37s-1]